MSKRNYNDEPAALDDLRRLFKRTQPPRTDVDVQEIFTSSTASQSRKNGPLQEQDVTTTKRGRWSMSLRAAAFVAVAASAFCWVAIPLISTDSIAFAEVKEQVEKVRTVEYVETSFSGDKQPAKPGEVSFLVPFGESGAPTLEKVIDQLETRLNTADAELAEDLEFELRVLRNLHGQDSKVSYVRRIRVKGKHLERTDQVFPIGRHHDVRSAVTGLNVSFDHVAKKKTILSKQVVLYKSGKKEEREIKKIPPTVDFFGRFRSVPSDATERLPVREIDGKDVVGFRSSEEHRGNTWTRTYWVLPESKLPVEMWTELRKGTHLKQRWVMNQFVFDRDMDDKLFSTETPVGYTSEKGRILALSPDYGE